MNRTAQYTDERVCSVHDGWGIAAKEGIKGNAIEAGTTTNMDTLAKENNYRTLAAHGLAVGLSDGLMGNSEVGYVLACNKLLSDAPTFITFPLVT